MTISYDPYAARMDGVVDLLLPMRTFVRVVEAGTFTAVAAELNTTQPTISRQVAALEDHLGTRLLTRSTRALTLTDDGRAFYEHAKRALEAVSEAEAAVGRRRSKPNGVLRLTCSGVFGTRHVVPRLERFLSRYPDVTIDLVMSDGVSDLVGEAIDLAIRIGNVADETLIARRIGGSRRVTVATPGYLAKRGTPKSPADLAEHDCIIYTRLASGQRWSFVKDGVTSVVEVNGPVHVNSTEAVREAILAGLGIGLVPVFHFDRELNEKQVVTLLDDHQPAAFPIHAVFPSRRYVPLKVRAMIDFLAAEFRLDPRLTESSL